MAHEIFKVGQRIKSFSFEPCEGRPDTYVEGTIVSVADGYYGVKVERDVWLGQELPKGKHSHLGNVIYTPIRMVWEYDNRLTLLGEV